MATAVKEDIAFYKSMVTKLRVVDLQAILSYIGKRTNGRKTELQSRVMNAIRSKNSAGMLKTKEVYATFLNSQKAERNNKEGFETVPTPGINNFRYVVPNPTPNYVQLFKIPNPASSSVTNLENNTMGPAVHPDVKFRKLPFYDLIDVLLRPSSLATVAMPVNAYSRQCITRQQAFQFYLSPQHIKHLQNKPTSAQIQIRLCVIDPAEQDDAFPTNLTIRVNNRCIPLPTPIPTNKQGAVPKRPAEPLNITNKCSFSVSSPTKVFVTWDDEYNSPMFALGIFLVDKLDSNDLIFRLKSKGNRPAEFTMGYIKEKYNSENDSEIKTLELTSSLLCPLGKMRMSIPTKASTCSHLQCFDGATFIKMNEMKPKWTCPVCDKFAYYDTLNIDGYFADIIASCPKTNEIQLRPDGTWTLTESKEENTNVNHKTTCSNSNHTYAPINLSSKADTVTKSQDAGADSPDIVTLDSDSESDGAFVEDEKYPKPPKKRFRPDENGDDPDFAMCVDLTEDSGDDCRPASSENNVNLFSRTNSTESSNQSPGFEYDNNAQSAPNLSQFPMFQSWMGLYKDGAKSPDTLTDPGVFTLSSTPPLLSQSQSDPGPIKNGDSKSESSGTLKYVIKPTQGVVSALPSSSSTTSNTNNSFSILSHTSQSAFSILPSSSSSSSFSSTIITSNNITSTELTSVTGTTVTTTSSSELSNSVIKTSNDIITLDDSSSPPPILPTVNLTIPQIACQSNITKEEIGDNSNISQLEYHLSTSTTSTLLQQTNTNFSIDKIVNNINKDIKTTLALTTTTTSTTTITSSVINNSDKNKSKQLTQKRKYVKKNINNIQLKKIHIKDISSDSNSDGDDESFSSASYSSKSSSPVIRRKRLTRISTIKKNITSSDNKEKKINKNNNKKVTKSKKRKHSEDEEDEEGSDISSLSSGRTLSKSSMSNNSDSEGTDFESSESISGSDTEFKLDEDSNSSSDV